MGLSFSAGSLTSSELWFPNITAQSGAYALVGMAAVFAAAARAPISAIIILFEMTGDYRIMLPLMLSTVIAMVLAGFLESESIYTLKLSRRGVHLARGRDVDVMQSVLVSEVMTTDTVPVSLSMNLGQVAHHFQTYQRHAFPVVDQNQVLCGIVSLQDLDRSLTLQDHEKLTTRSRRMETTTDTACSAVARSHRGSVFNASHN